jgi:hypothetical protein
VRCVYSSLFVFCRSPHYWIHHSKENGWWEKTPLFDTCTCLNRWTKFPIVYNLASIIFYDSCMSFIIFGGIPSFFSSNHIWSLSVESKALWDVDIRCNNHVTLVAASLGCWWWCYWRHWKGPFVWRSSLQQASQHGMLPCGGPLFSFAAARWLRADVAAASLADWPMMRVPAESCSSFCCSSVIASCRVAVSVAGSLAGGPMVRALSVAGRVAAALLTSRVAAVMISWCKRRKHSGDWLMLTTRVRVTLWLTVSQSVRLGVEPWLGLMTRCFFFLESYSPVHVWRTLWREVRPVICQSSQ